MKENQATYKIKFIISMLIFGSIGLVRRYIPLSSSLIAFFRSFLGAGFLILVVILKKEEIRLQQIKSKFKDLALSGIFLAVNWILLFEAFQYATVALATLSYYMAPVLLILTSSIFFRANVSKERFFLAFVALFGMVLVSGVLESEIKGAEGIVFGLAAAIFYVLVILMNKKLDGLNPYERTIGQLFVASICLLPYLLLTENLDFFLFDSRVIIYLLIIGLVYTGLSYLFYFDGVAKLPLETSAILSYLDPALAVLISLLILNEPLSNLQLFGSLVMIVAMVLSEVYGSREENQKG